MLSEKISIREAKMKLIFGAWLSDLNGLRLQLCITFLTHLIKIRDSLLSVTSSLPGLMIQVLRSFYSSTHASSAAHWGLFMTAHVSRNPRVRELLRCLTQLLCNSTFPGRLKPAEGDAEVSLGCPLSARRLISDWAPECWCQWPAFCDAHYTGSHRPVLGAPRPRVSTWSLWGILWWAASDNRWHR